MTELEIYVEPYREGLWNKWRASTTIKLTDPKRIIHRTVHRSVWDDSPANQIRVRKYGRTKEQAFERCRAAASEIVREDRKGLEKWRAEVDQSETKTVTV